MLNPFTPSQILLLASVLATSTASLLVDHEPPIFADLLKRQQPGTPAYNCHDNCGTAITLTKSSPAPSLCTNDIFLHDYANCLQCAGPDNADIWKYYSGSLIPVAQGCGLETEPKEGEQEGVGAARHPGDEGGSGTMTATATATAGAGESTGSSYIYPTSNGTARATATASGPTSTAPVEQPIDGEAGGVRVSMVGVVMVVGAVALGGGLLG